MNIEVKLSYPVLQGTQERGAALVKAYVGKYHVVVEELVHLQTFFGAPLRWDYPVGSMRFRLRSGERTDKAGGLWRLAEGELARVQKEAGLGPVHPSRQPGAAR